LKKEKKMKWCSFAMQSTSDIQNSKVNVLSIFL